MAERKGKHYDKPSGEPVEFFFGANSQYQKGEVIPISVNGYKYEARVGHRNTLPREVVQLLKDAKSRTERVTTKQYDPSQGGVPRSDKDFFNPQKDTISISEFDIEELGVR